MQKTEYRDTNLSIDFYPVFLDYNLTVALYNYFEQIHWTRKSSRSTLIFANHDPNKSGNSGITYSVNYNDITTERETVQFPDLIKFVKDLVEKQTNNIYTVCIVQRYPNGNVGIGYHRDKEMLPGTTIAGISIGETRRLNVKRGFNLYHMDLINGSLYVLNPPTNDYYVHSILKDSTKNVRYSLTFRNYQ